MILPGKYVDRMYQEKKMSVKVKDVGSYKIHVKESSMQKTWAFAFFYITAIIGIIIEFSWIWNVSINPLIPLAGIPIALISLFGLSSTRVFPVPAYYVDTTMYGIGGKKIRKATPEQDHIAICKASHEFEIQILERIEKEDELKAIVGICK